MANCHISLLVDRMGRYQRWKVLRGEIPGKFPVSCYIKGYGWKRHMAGYHGYGIGILYKGVKSWKASGITWGGEFQLVMVCIVIHRIIMGNNN